MEMRTEKIKYPYLPEGHKILYVGLDNSFMAEAKETAKLSNDLQQPTGAVIVSENKIISRASNRNPLTSPFLINLHKKYCIRHILKVPSGEKYWLCPGCGDKGSHAESRAVKQLLSRGVPEKPLDLYLWGHWWCCQDCWNYMLDIHINNVYLLKDSEILFNMKNPDNIIGRHF